MLRIARCQRRKARHEEVQSWKRHHINGQLAQVGVQLARKAQARRHAGHGQRHQVVQVAVLRVGYFQRAEADVVQCLVIDAVCFVGVFDQLMNRQRCVVRFDDCVAENMCALTPIRDEATRSIGRKTNSPVSDTFGDGTTEYVFIIRSGNSSRIFDMSSVPMPLPVPPPSECVN